MMTPGRLLIFTLLWAFLSTRVGGQTVSASADTRVPVEIWMWVGQVAADSGHEKWEEKVLAPTDIKPAISQGVFKWRAPAGFTLCEVLVTDVNVSGGGKRAGYRISTDPPTGIASTYLVRVGAEQEDVPDNAGNHAKIKVVMHAVPTRLADPAPVRSNVTMPGPFLSSGITQRPIRCPLNVPEYGSPDRANGHGLIPQDANPAGWQKIVLLMDFAAPPGCPIDGTMNIDRSSPVAGCPPPTLWLTPAENGPDN
ncbi:hypothetical protein [Paraburkholderia dipogonis]|uniref:hypothetical protein n=1 Tax=Paraburkholderia dipogonis TaxID=1211383 RepID=UPI0038B6F2D2